MSKKDVVIAVAAKTGQSPAQCEATLEAFEAICGDALTCKFKGVKHGHTHAITELASKTGQNEQDCQAIMSAFEEVLDEALSAKLGFLRKRVS